MLTAEVLALTTRVDKQVAAKTPPVRVVVSVLIRTLPRSASNTEPEQWGTTSGDTSMRLLSCWRGRHSAGDHRSQSQTPHRPVWATDIFIPALSRVLAGKQIPAASWNISEI
jgi:hypothetical protein